MPMTNPTTTTTTPTIDRTADGVVPALLDLVRTLAPTADPATLRPKVHALASTVRAALGGVASLVDLLDAVVTATAGPPVEPVRPEPWAALLSLDLDAFAATGVGLRVALPHRGETIWLTGSAATAHHLAVEQSAWPRLVKGLDWMRSEAERGGFPTAERSVGRFVEGLGGMVVGWVPAPAGSGG
jgi:hypothetical protein